MQGFINWYHCSKTKQAVTAAVAQQWQKLRRVNIGNTVVQRSKQWHQLLHKPVKDKKQDVAVETASSSATLLCSALTGYSSHDE